MKSNPLLGSQSRPSGLFLRMGMRLASVLLALGLASLACNFPGILPDETEAPPPPTEPDGEQTEIPPTAPFDAESAVLAIADRDGVFTIGVDEARQALLAPNQAQLLLGQGVDVDAAGRAILRFSDLLSVEVLRDGELTVQQLSFDEQSVIVSVIMVGGMLLNDFNPEAEIDKRFTIQTEFATITATGTRFVVASEMGTDLEWVVAFDSEEGDLQVTADGVSKDVPSGIARWVAPIGEPSAGIEALQDNVVNWTERVRQGIVVPEIGEIVWSAADLILGTFLLGQLPEVDQPATIAAVDLTLDSKGIDGDPGYGFADCDGDGVEEIISSRGVTFLDFRDVPARVRAVDVTILNFSDSGGVLWGLDPGQNLVARAEVTAEGGEVQTLSLRSDVPLHYAQLTLEDGCFLGFSLTPPLPDGSPAPPRPAPGDSAYITDIFIDSGLYSVEFVTTGFVPQLPGQHVHFFFDTVPPEEAGTPGDGPWFLYGGPSPFTGYKLSDRPPGATQMCILVANADHSVQFNTGNCVDLPG